MIHLFSFSSDHISNFYLLVDFLLTANKCLPRPRFYKYLILLTLLATELEPLTLALLR